MQRKVFHQKDYDNGDRRIMEAAELAASEWFGRPILNLSNQGVLTKFRKPLVDKSYSHDVNSLCAMYNYPVEMLGSEHAVTYNVLPFDNLGI